jgi:hypothetical protein
VLTAHDRVVGAVREYLIHGDQALRDGIDEVAARGRRAVTT